MWTITKVPSNYTAPDDEEWCIIDDSDGSIWDFYYNEDDAEQALKVLKEED